MACYNAPNNNHYQAGHEEHYCEDCTYSAEALKREESPCYLCLGAALSKGKNRRTGQCNWKKGDS